MEFDIFYCLEVSSSEGRTNIPIVISTKYFSHRIIKCDTDAIFYI